MLAVGPLAQIGSIDTKSLVTSSLSWPPRFGVPPAAGLAPAAGVAAEPAAAAAAGFVAAAGALVAAGAEVAAGAAVGACAAGVGATVGGEIGACVGLAAVVGVGGGEPPHATSTAPAAPRPSFRNVRREVPGGVPRASLRHIADRTANVILASPPTRKPWVERAAQPVAHEIERQHRQEDRRPGRE